MVDNTLVVITKGIPFESGGTAAIVRNLFANVNNKTKVCLLGRRAEYFPSDIVTPYECFEIPLSNQKDNIITKIVLFFRSLRIGIKVIKTEKSVKILGIYRDESSLVLSYMLSLFTKLPLNIYFTDLYAEQYTRFLPKVLQSVIFRRAQNIFCLTEGMREEYAQLYSVETKLLPHTISDLNNCYRKDVQRIRDEFIIGYAGTIIPERIDLLRELVRIVGENVNYKLKLFTPHEASFFQRTGLQNDSVNNEYIKNHETLISRLHECDLLYLPLTFTCRKDDLQLKTCLGTKSFDYLQSGSEILVHSPKDYLTYTFFEKNNIGFLLDRNEKGDLADKLDIITKQMRAAEFSSSDYAHVLKNHEGIKVYDYMIQSIFDE